MALNENLCARQPIAARLAAGLLAASATACVTVERLDPPPAAVATMMASANPIGFGAIRLDAAKIMPGPHNPIETALRRTQRFELLALSGGGARGAYAAGLLVGWTQTGKRPQFSVVTGVSAGALAAPFAFIGPEADAKLEVAFTSGAALLKRAGPQSLFRTSLFPGAPLRALVESFIDDEVLTAVAREYAKGRMLLVVTSDIDSQRTVVWDMGAIAAKGGAPARALFIDVLVASASIPGIFPPVLIDVVDANNVRHQELHVDGGVTTPFLAVPEALLLSEAPESEGLKGHIWVVLNDRVDPDPNTTKLNTVAVLARSFDTMQRSSTRIAMTAVRGFAERNDLQLTFNEPSREAMAAGTTFDFSAENMRGLFEAGRRSAGAMLAGSGAASKTPTAQTAR